MCVRDVVRAASRVADASGNASNSESLLNWCHAASMSAGLHDVPTQLRAAVALRVAYWLVSEIPIVCDVINYAVFSVS